MKQIAPDPVELFDLVEKCKYRPGWTVRVDDIKRDKDFGRGESSGLTLIITTNTINAYHPEQKVMVNHYFIVPAATYDRRSWQRWLFERFRDVESHECAEFFRFEYLDTTLGTLDKVAEVERPYAPSHGPGNDPY